jgi:2-oxo-4-hydroxy-4-carboxy--5-ureidoimidazoline (OHCU) decarboxylase
VTKIRSASTFGPRRPRCSGSPEEVAEKAADQLSDAVAWLATLTEQTSIQTQNAYKTELLNEQPSLTAAELAETWEQSDRKAGLDRLETLAAALYRGSQDLS